MSTNDARDELRRVVRQFLERRSTESDVRRLMEDEAGYDPAVWTTMADQLGLQAMAIPEELGGAGFGYQELCVVFEEMGRALLPSPFFATVGLAATALLECGDQEAMKRHLPAIASGELVATLAVGEERGGWDESAVDMRAQPSGSGWTLSGVKRFVPDAHVSGLLLVVARTAEGLSLFAVDPHSAGCTVEVELTLDLTRKLSRVRLDATPAVLVGRAGQAWDGVRRALRFAAVALACEQVGGARRVLDMTLDHVTVRHQFGRPVGSFQAVKHKLADMLVDIESARSAAYDAARAVAERDADVELAASVAKAVCSDTYTRAAATAIQLHGGIGFTWEHAAQLYYKRAKSSEFLLGTPGHHRDLVGRALGI
ncbi:acyl-CoA dehydrogenase family protein [Pseudonocardia dioxanivorans]|jgi:alkylation response protein AidB-like acyl-CoA dehydrogenase|uniref:acyl-CoA dehydrogenase family protein n=1 Tax=Pseudonocardia dioxanivorans TaxID=240495 RepID=UPI000CD10AC7|nr:acyl-CoA dehydrogenase family protein [Pseudonocardia dioxanivorans]